MNTIKVKQIVQAVSVALACSASIPAFAADGVLFDQDGSGGGANVSTVTKFEWGVGNVFAVAALKGTGAANNAVTGASTILIQENLSAFVPAAALFQEFTFQLSVAATPTLSGNKLSWADGGGASFFRIYAGGAAYNEVTGNGYNGSGGAVLILSGTAKITTMSFTQNTDLPIVGLDNNGSGGDVDNNITSIQGDGSGTFEIDVTFAHTGYFLTDITSSLTLDMNLTGTNSAPFNTGEPSDNVVGVNLTGSTGALNDAYGSDDGDLVAAGIQRVNNFDCGTLANGDPRTCGFHMQGDHSSVVFHTFDLPEPGSLALLGMGLGLLGWRSRKWTQQS